MWTRNVLQSGQNQMFQFQTFIQAGQPKTYKDTVAKILKKQIGQTLAAKTGRINVDTECPVTRGHNQFVIY